MRVACALLSGALRAFSSSAHAVGVGEAGMTYHPLSKEEAELTPHPRPCGSWFLVLSTALACLDV